MSDLIPIESRIWIPILASPGRKLLPTMNDWQHRFWAAKGRLKREWAVTLRTHAMLQNVTIPPARADETRIVEVIRRSVRFVDDDNVVSPAGKLILDPMKLIQYRKVGGKRQRIDGVLGWIYDDDPAHVKFSARAEKVGSREEQGTLVAITWWREKGEGNE